GPRNVHWRPTHGATLVWTEGLDGGDPRKKVAHRDRMMALAAPFDGKPAEVVKTEHRLVGVQYGEKGLALGSHYDRAKRRRRTHAHDLEAKEKPALIGDLSGHDPHKAPGTPLTRH